MEKNNISLIINCQKEDIEYINMAYFNDKYARVYFDIKPESKEYLNKILTDVETKYYSIWNFDKEYKNLDDLDILLNRKYKKIEYIANPEISVIVCLYNTKPKLFKDCINGLVNQTFKNFEVLIVNDGSDKYYNENRLIVSQLNDNRFIWINKEHSGKSQTLNLALEKVRGKYIAINDSDDISYTERLEYQYNWLENNVDYEYISNAMLKNYLIFPNNAYTSKEITIKDNYLAVFGNSMFKKSILQKLYWYFDKEFDTIEDYIFVIRCIAYNIKMYYSSEILAIYSQCNTNAYHLQALKYRKDESFRLSFYAYSNQLQYNDLLTIVIDSSNIVFNSENLEKLILSIKMKISQNNVKIILYDSQQKYHFLSTIYHILNFSKYDDVIQNVMSKYVYYINYPVIINTLNFDLKIYDVFNFLLTQNDIMVPQLQFYDKLVYGYYLQYNKNKDHIVLLSQYLNYKKTTNEYALLSNIFANNLSIFISSSDNFKKYIKYFMNISHKNFLNDFLYLNHITNTIYVHNDLINQYKVDYKLSDSEILDTYKESKQYVSNIDDIISSKNILYGIYK